MSEARPGVTRWEDLDPKVQKHYRHAKSTGHVCFGVEDGGQWIATHVDSVIWFSEPGERSLMDDDSMWTRWDDYIKLEVANGTWIWKFTGRTCTNRFAGNTLHEARWPD